MVIHTGMDYRVYEFGPLHYLRNLKSEDPVVLYPKQVAFAEQGTRIVTGSDRRKAIVYNAETGNVVQNLDFVGHSMVQPIGVSPTQHNVVFQLAHLKV